MFGIFIQRRRNDGRPSAVEAARTKMNTISAAMAMDTTNAMNDAHPLLNGARSNCTRRSPQWPR